MKHLIWIICFYPISVFAQDEWHITDDNISEIDTVWVYTPEDYSSGITYPVVYLLHGYSGTYKQWSQISDLQRYADEYGFVIVCPDGLYNSWYLNSPLIKSSQYKNFFFDTLIPTIRENYSVAKDKQFITGLSMGGHGALYLYSENTDMFVAAGSISGVLDLTIVPNSYELKDHFGPINGNTDLWQVNSANGRLYKFTDARPIIFDCGIDDPFYESNVRFYELCKKNEVPATFISRPGKHDAAYWKNAIPFHFEFFQRQLEK